MLIDNPYPANWKDLQSAVQRIFKNVGLHAEVEVDLDTPRGSINVDVLATDLRSLDKITYIVECKNWKNPIPQSVVHSFTTVMHETGANIGYIISIKGLQAGALKYLQNTNITGMTYKEFQEKYFEAWWGRYFCPLVGDTADQPLQYVEPINSFREKEYGKLSIVKKKEFDSLVKETYLPVTAFSMLNHGYFTILPSLSKHPKSPKNLDCFKADFLSVICPEKEWNCNNFRELLEEITLYLIEIKSYFDDIFGRPIFGNGKGMTGVTMEGPPLND